MTSTPKSLNCKILLSFVENSTTRKFFVRSTINTKLSIVLDGFGVGISDIDGVVTREKHTKELDIKHSLVAHGIVFGYYNDIVIVLKKGVMLKVPE